MLFGFFSLFPSPPPRQPQQLLSYFAERYIPLFGGYRRVVGSVGVTFDRA